MRQDRVIPISVKRIWSQPYLLQLSSAHFDALGIQVGVELSPHLQASLRAGDGNQLDDNGVTDKWPPPPILANKGKQPVLDLVPLRGARRIVVDVEREARRIGELLEFDLPQPDARAVRTGRCDRDGWRLRVS